MTNIFQTPWLLLFISLVVLLVVAVWRQNYPEKQRWWQLLLPLGLAAGALALDYFVRTDYEKIILTIRRARDACVAEDVDMLATTLSPEYSDISHGSRSELTRFLRSFFATTKIEKAPQKSGQVLINAPTATAENMYRVHLEANNAYTQAASMYFVKVRIRLRKDSSAQWLINGCELMELNFQPFHWGDL